MITTHLFMMELVGAATGPPIASAAGPYTVGPSPACIYDRDRTDKWGTAIKVVVPSTSAASVQVYVAGMWPVNQWYTLDAGESEYFALGGDLLSQVYVRTKDMAASATAKHFIAAMETT